MFCVTLIKPSCPDWQATEDFFHLATAGLIRACVERSDGTSNLILQGLRRVRFTSFEQEKPFPIVSIDIIESREPTTVETEALGAKVIELYGSLKHDHRQLPAKLDQYLSELRDLEMLADLMASTFVNDPLRLQRLLEERSLNQRLRFLINICATKSATPPHRQGQRSALSGRAARHPYPESTRFLPSNTGPSFPRCNRIPCDAIPRSRFASRPRPVCRDRPDTPGKPGETFRMRVDSLPRRADYNKHSGTRNFRNRRFACDKSSL